MGRGLTSSLRTRQRSAGLAQEPALMLINEKSYIQPLISKLFPHPLTTCKIIQNPIKAQNKLEMTQI